VVLYKETSAAKLLERLSGLQSVIIEKNVKLVVIDSIAGPIRQEFDAMSQTNSRQEILTNIASVLKLLGDKFRIPIVVTNQVANKFKEAQLTAALGVAWAHAVNTRFVLENVGSKKSIKIAKSPCDALSSFEYQITDAGVMLKHDN